MSETENTAVIEMREVSIGAMRDISFVVLEDVNWLVAPGEFWTVAGQQFSGKSNFLMLTAGLMAPVKGECRLFGTDTRTFGEAKLAERLHVGLVFAGGQLFNQLTIRENVALPLQYHRDLPPAEAASAVQTLLELLELTPLADITPSNISDNWRQRAALARALILKPKVLLLDNPLAGLGTRHLHWWLRFLDQLSRGHDWCGGRPMTVVATTDDLRPWRNANRKFALLRDKKFFPLGSWNEVESANDPVVKELLAVPLETII
ncbi:MAG TPA: ATP-binding cassette domain-containing protein [Candidatus Limnocylindrales bacterium]|nr:ATP-binding cassette domain-containing protein [Candidatus Limnocylindrales bacterium]